MFETNFTKEQTFPNRRVLSLVASILCLALCALVLYVYAQYLNTPTPSFPTGRDIVVEEGGTVNSVAEQLEREGVIRSSLYLYYILTKNFPESYIHAGVYVFDTPTSTYEIAHALTQGSPKVPLFQMTFPEGFKADDIANYLPPELQELNFENVKQHEGYLFPDTYFIASHTTADEIVKLLLNTFTDKLAPYQEEIAASTFSEKDVVILASILEREAKDKTSKKIVSGILQNRLTDGMPLQVDATFDYILGKASHELTIDDLAMDSPYNTYIHTGLPPAPIANPGLEAIEAVLEPTVTDYYYYLTDSDGVFHYAKTFEDHKRNKERYLR